MAAFALLQSLGRGAALAGMLALAGCGSVVVFGRYDLPESPDVAAAAYPRLVDTPEAPPPGVHGPGVPDPAVGAAIVADLSRRADAAAQRAAILNDPVLSEAERLRLLRAARRRR